MKKWMVALAVLVVLAVIAASAVVAARLVWPDGDEAIKKNPKEDESSSAPVGGTLKSFYNQEIDWEDCGSNECGELEVPVDYQLPDGETISLALEKVPATGDDPVGSLVVNPGGPGAPGTQMAEQADSYFKPELLEAYDIVAFDPRGTGDSAPVDCLSDSDLDDYVAMDPDPDNAAEVKKYESEQKAFWQGCADNTGELLGHVTTAETARDMDVLRGVLGEEKLHYLGFSYGTRLGSTYAELFADKVGRFVLDAATDPLLTARESALSQASGFETALRSYVQDCVDGGDCYLGDSLGAGMKTITDLLAQIDAKPLPASGERDLEIGNAFYGLILPLYNEENWPLLDQGLQEAMDGKGDTLLTLSDYYGSREGGGYTDNSLEAISVINCLDDPSAIPVSEVRAQYPEFTKASPSFGKVFAWFLPGCGDILVKSSEPELEIKAEGADPILVVGTTRDPATPYEEAVALAEQLDSGVLLSRDGDGHAAYNRGNDCVDDTIHKLLIDGEAPTSDVDC